MNRTDVVFEQISTYLGLEGHREQLRVLLDIYTAAYIMDLEESEAAEDAEAAESIVSQPVEEPKSVEETHTQANLDVFPASSVMTGQDPTEEQEAYHGFLHLRCPHCGEIKSFCAKIPISSYYCSKCQSESVMENISFASVECDCGAHWTYKTNITDWGFDIICLRCAAPVAVEYHNGAGQFVTIGRYKMRKKEKQ